MRRFFVAIFGGTLLLLGIAMIVLPGPAGLAVLGTEFFWARRVLHRCKGVAAKARENLRWGSSKGKKPATDGTDFTDNAAARQSRNPNSILPPNTLKDAKGIAAKKRRRRKTGNR